MPLGVPRRPNREHAMDIGSNMSAEMRASLKKAEEAIELHALMERIEKIDLSAVSTATEKIVRGLASFDLVKARSPAKKKPGRSGANHWKARKARAQAKRSRAYVAEKKKRKYEWEGIWKEAKASGDEVKAWYLWLSRESTRMAHKKRAGWEISEDQFREFLFPCIVDAEGVPQVPVFQRYDKKGKWSLYNIWMTVEGKVVYDGKECLLRSLGYIL